ncbi:MULTISPECIES: protein translocase subunit SecF [unclassified Desulfovibrio]|uniref:protein translocase subunit SecF n=1 Tax=unclassified Desulfovibrio TaxID=2593640 RepID=UPI000F5FE986|nr:MULTISPECIES: protein translocase subunit SecF [unclassified Desulfovibrio]RRD69487.1 protein translocase subunit SecF [Desulfovibrio sp. OH1209_COT-279]RRD86166.1 protein translocase subunit SecF [Desulfovibrio sp. OH1186_COT-070]
MGFAFIRHDTNFDFMGLRYWSYGISTALLLIGLFSAIWGSGLRMGIDFAGGVIVQVQFQNPVEDEALKKSLDIPELPGISTQRFGEGGKSYLLRFSQAADGDTALMRNTVVRTLGTAFPGNAVEVERMEVVGPKIGADLTNKALSALYYAVLLIAVYISGRFEQRWMAGAAMAAALWGGMYVAGFTGLGMGWLVMIALAITLTVCFVLRLNFALGAVVGLLHDVLVTVGLLCLLGVEIDLNVMAALLTLVGYSLNDTIIVYDRLRENLRAATGKMSMAELINRSVNQTLSRTILTSGTTFLATLSLFLLGGGVIHDFSLTMLIGVVVGTASSIYVSSAVLLSLGSMDFYVNLVQQQETWEKPGEHGIV